MDIYDKIIHITNFDDYKKVCDKLYNMWYEWCWGAHRIKSYRTDFITDYWNITLYTYIGKKYVCHWINREEAISASKFLNVYDL